MKRLVLAAMFAVLASSSLGCICCQPACGDPCGGALQSYHAADDCQESCDDGCGQSHGGGCDWGCGERYWGDWFEKRSPCCEPCDQCANWTGDFNHPPMSVGRPANGDSRNNSRRGSGENEPTPVPAPPKSSMKYNRTSR